MSQAQYDDTFKDKLLLYECLSRLRYVNWFLYEYMDNV